MTNTNTSNQITKFQDLKVDETYHVTSFKPVDSKFGKTYILTIMKNGEDLKVDETYHVTSFKPVDRKFGKTYILTIMKNGEELDIFSTKSINEFFKLTKLEEHPTKFDFPVRRITKGNYID